MFCCQVISCTLLAYAKRVYFLFYKGGIILISEEKKLWAVELLQKKCNEIGRIPKKEDFDEVTRSQIKSFLGPWPRALESAGLKKKKNSKKTKF